PKTLARTGATHRATVHPTGGGSPDTWMPVPLGDGGSALPSFYSADMDFDSDAEVRFTSLDALLPEVLEDLPGPAEDAGEPRPRVTGKIDVEGGENDGVAHGRAFIDTLRPDILCEALNARATPPEV